MTKNYDNSIVIKPWGKEYNIFRVKKKFAITYLKIKKNNCTSLHCHPKKKTGFLILSGGAYVQLGIYKKNTSYYKPMSILVLRPGLFHKISAPKNTDLYALEIETPYIKSDLIRFKDEYGRQSKGYESLKYSKKIETKNVIFKLPKVNKPNIYKLNNVKIVLSYFKSFNSYKNFDDKSVSVICDGELTEKNGRTVISAGEIVRSYTLKKLENFYKIKNKILIMKAIKLKKT